MGHGVGEYSRYTIITGSAVNVHRHGSLEYKGLFFQGIPGVQSTPIIITPHFSHLLSTKAFPAAPPSPAVCW